MVLTSRPYCMDNVDLNYIEKNADCVMKYRFGMEYCNKTLQKLHIAKLQQELRQKMFVNLCRTFLFEFFIID